MIKGALLSKCGTYRYALWRLFRPPNEVHMHAVGHGEVIEIPMRYVMWIGLNPSTADATQDDPTIRRCIGFTKTWGYDGMFMCNLFAYRATDPRKMLAEYEPRVDGQNIVGEYTNKASIVGGCKNAQTIYHVQKKCAGVVIACWGSNKHAFVKDRAWRVTSMFVEQHPINRDLHCLAMTSDFSPWHPLYVKGDTKPIVYRQCWNSGIRELDERGKAMRYNPLMPDAADMPNGPMQDMVERGKNKTATQVMNLHRGRIVENRTDRPLTDSERWDEISRGRGVV